MQYFKEEEFYKDHCSPTEELIYCAYEFYLPNTDSQPDHNRDYDQFALVQNSEYPYIRLAKKRGKHKYPCGTSSYVPVGGYYASLTDEERESLCPKIAFGIAAFFIAHLGYDCSQKDYYLLEDKNTLNERYYTERLARYLKCYSGLKYTKISVEQKELDFIEVHLPIIKSLWERSWPLKEYSQLYSYAEEAETEYEAFVQNRIKDLTRITMGISKQFSTAISETCGNQYVKVYFLDDSRAEEAKVAVESLNEIKKVNITNSMSIDHPGKTLTVYPKSMVSAADCLKIVENALTLFFSNIKETTIQGHNEAYFAGIEKRIIEALDRAMAMVDVCVAWFTNTNLKNKLLEIQKKGVKVRIITFRDGVNAKSGVDFTGLEHKERRSERGGILHDKFCVIDNVTVISGSYNWTLNAENKNDEDAAFCFGDVKQASAYTKRFNEMWDNDK